MELFDTSAQNTPDNTCQAGVDLYWNIKRSSESFQSRSILRTHAGLNKKSESYSNYQTNLFKSGLIVKVVLFQITIIDSSTKVILPFPSEINYKATFLIQSVHGVDHNILPFSSNALNSEDWYYIFTKPETRQAYFATTSLSISSLHWSISFSDSTRVCKRLSEYTLFDSPVWVIPLEF